VIHENLVYPRRSDEGLTLETSAFQSLYGVQFTLSTPWINQIFVSQISPFCRLLADFGGTEFDSTRPCKHQRCEAWRLEKLQRRHEFCFER